MRISGLNIPNPTNSLGRIMLSRHEEKGGVKN